MEFVNHLFSACIIFLGLQTHFCVILYVQGGDYLTLGDRIKYLRKELKMSQKSFGEKLGTTRDAINNIEMDRLKRPDQKESLYRLICKEFHVNYDWLVNGEGDMYLEDAPEDEFTRAMVEIDVKDPKARQAILDYWKLDDTDKQLWWDFMGKFLKKKQED